MIDALAALKSKASGPSLAQIRSALGSDAKLHIVGGTVRDLLLDKPPLEVDLAGALPPEQGLARLQAAGLKVVPTGLKHGTLTIVIDGEHFELTTFRRPSAREESRFADTIETDLSGRDFTINALAYDPERNLLLDPFGGMADLKFARLRAVGSAPERFKEDPLRILRMLRFGPAQGRAVEQETLAAAGEHRRLLSKVSIERITAEFSRILLSPNPRAALRTAQASGIMEEILPEFLPAVGFEQNEFHTQDVFEHSLSVLQAAPPDLILRLAALFHDIGKVHTLSTDASGRRHFYEHEAASARICKDFMTRWRFSNEQISAVNCLIALHMRPLGCGPAGVRRLIKELGPHFERWIAFKIADVPPTVPIAEFEAELARFQEMLEAERERQKGPAYGKLAINGDDLIALGMKPGAELGAVLKRIEDLVIEDPELNQKEILINTLYRLNLL